MTDKCENNSSSLGSYKLNRGSESRIERPFSEKFKSRTQSVEKPSNSLNSTQNMKEKLEKMEKSINARDKTPIELQKSEC